MEEERAILGPASTGFPRYCGHLYTIPGSRLVMYIKLPGSLGEESSFSRDMSIIGHWGTGDLEVNIRTEEDWERARQLVDQVYQQIWLGG